VPHVYDREAFNPMRRKFFMGNLDGTWEWDPDPAQRSFEWLGPPPVTCAGGSTFAWDPVRNRMLQFQLSGPCASINWYNYSTHTWVLMDTYIPPTTTWRVPLVRWDANASQFFVAYGNFNFFLYDPTKVGAAAWTEITAGVPIDVKGGLCSPSAARPCWYRTFDFDTNRNLMIHLTGDGPSGSGVFSLWAYNARAAADPASAACWQKITTNATATLGSRCDTDGYRCNIHYDPGTDTLYSVETQTIYESGPGGSVRTMKVQLDLSHPLPTATPVNTPPVTPTGPMGTPSVAFTATRTPTGPTATPVQTGTPTPTCAGTVRLVGPGRTYTKVSQAAAVAQSNDCIYIDAGTYTNDFALARWLASAANLTIRGTGGKAKMTIANGDLSTGMGSDGSKGIWVINGNNTTVENIEFSCATSRTNNTNCSGVLVGDGNDAGIRLQAAGLTVRDCLFHDNDDGILGGPVGVTIPTGNILIERTEFFRNGLGDGQTHNVYLGLKNATVTFRNNYSHGAIIGHQFKSRAPVNYILYNRIMDDVNGVVSTPGAEACTDPATCGASVEIEIPCGGLSYVIGNVIQKGANADSADIIKYAAENASTTNCPPPLPTQELYVINNTIVNERPSTSFFVRGFGAAPLLWAKNNIFWGAGTPITWPVGGTAVQTTNVVADPKFLSPNTYDYRLTALSTAVINQGVDPGTDSHGYSLVPTQQYIYDRAFTTRPSDGVLDVGAFEYVVGAGPFPTSTATPTNTQTPTPIPTPTPGTPLYCAAGQREAVYPIAVSTDDGVARRIGASYAALGTPMQWTGGYGDYIDYVVRKNAGSAPFVTELMYWRWNTATLPDGSAWPAGTQIVGALLRPYWVGPGSGARPLVFEWHNWTPPLADADWTNGSATAADPTFAATTAEPTAAGRQNLTLNNAAANIALASYSGIRLTVSDTTPPAVNEDNTIPVRPQDFRTSGGDQSTQLVVCYVLGPPPTPQRPPAPNLL